jgi:hypothetical protein
MESRIVVVKPENVDGDPTNGLRDLLEVSKKGDRFKMIFCGFECDVQISSIFSKDWGGSRPGNLLVSMRILGDPIGDVSVISLNTTFELDENTKLIGFE